MIVLIYLMTTFKLKYLALLAISDRIRQLHWGFKGWL